MSECHFLFSECVSVDTYVNSKIVCLKRHIPGNIHIVQYSNSLSLAICDPILVYYIHNIEQLFSSGLSQRGEDEEGILGFLEKDIKQELARGKRLVSEGR